MTFQPHHRIAGHQAAANSSKTPAHLREHQRRMASGSGEPMASPKLITGLKPLNPAFGSPKVTKMKKTPLKVKAKKISGKAMGKGNMSAPKGPQAAGNPSKGPLYGYAD